MKYARFVRKNSVFWKLFGILVLIGVGSSSLIGFGLRLAVHPNFDDHFRLNGEQYAHYLVRDIGTAPDFKQGKELAERLGIGIRIEGAGWRWASGSEVPPMQNTSERHHQRWRHSSGHGPYVVVDHVFPGGPAKVMVVAPKRPEMETNYSAVAILIGILAAILALSYGLIRWVLRPIDTLTEGVEQLSHGNLKHRVAIESHDELGNLANAFNAMVGSVKEMLASKQQLLIDVSHELRSPLTRAKLGLEMVEDSETVRQVRTELDEVERMIAELLEVARLESGHGSLETKPTDIVALAQYAVAQYVAIGQCVRIAEAPTSAVAPVDADRLKSVLRNLIDNALKYSQSDSEVAVSVFSNERNVRIEIADKGPGIAADELGKVFEPFYRVDKSRTRSTGGFGLGLSLCKKIVRAHGGSIELQTKPGSGTCVIVTLPK